MTTPADELRAAAETLRRDAEAARRASPPPWTVTDEHVVRCADGMVVADRSGTDHPAERADLPYIAAMHPGVGAALAKWLESWTGIDFNEHAAMAGDLAHALAVARQITAAHPTT
jgi:hypothetical protein